MFQAQARAVIRRDGSGVMEIGAHDMGQGAGTALAQIAADGLGLDVDQVEFRSGTSDLPDAGIAGGSAHTATAGMAIHGAGADVIARLAELAMGDERSPLFGAGNAGVVARGRPAVPPRRRKPQRELCRHPRPRRPRGNRGAGQQRGRPGGAVGLRHACARRGVRRGEGRSRSGADPRHPSGRRLRGRPGDQSAAGAQPVLWRHDLGRIVRPARARRHGPTLRPPDESRISASTMCR